jgi:hypothetical protein
MKRMIAMLALAVAALAAEAGEKKAEHDHKAHVAPHGGALVSVGDHFANVEFVLDAASGKLTAYVLDGCAENAVRIKQKELSLKFELVDGLDSTLELKMKSVGNVLTGETEGDSSQFEAQSDALKKVKTFEAILEAIEIKGQKAKDVDFNYPKGNEAGHKH